MRHTLVLALALALCVPASAGGIVAFEGPPGGVGDIQIVDPAGITPAVSPPALRGIRLLDFEVNGRTDLRRFLPGGVWRFEDVPGAARVLLPRQQGSLYHFERPGLGSASDFGFFVVDEAGEARLVLERPGTGALANLDPFEARVAVAPDGLSLLAATSQAAGGDLLEVDLELGTWVNRTQALGPQQFTLRGLALNRDWGVAVATTGVLRFDPAGAGDATSVDFGATPPTWFQGDVVLSGNGLFAVTVAGQLAPLGDSWVFGVSGSATNVSQAPMELSGAGYLPEALHGPYMAVSDDGSTCAWRVEGLTREAFLARVNPPAGQSPQHVSSNAWYTDTLDEIGQYAFRPGLAAALLAVGSLSATAPFDLESADFYEISLDALGAPVFKNITLTSGVSQAPFLVASELKPRLASWTADAGALLFHDDQAEELVAMRPGQSGVQVILPDVKELYRIDPVGADLVASLRRSTGNKDNELHLVPASAIPPTVSFFTTPDVNEITNTAARDDGVFAFVERLPTHEFMWLYDAPAASLQLLTQRPLRYGPTLGLGPAGELAFSVGVTGNPAVFAQWPYPASPKRLIFPVTPGVVLPGI